MNDVVLSVGDFVALLNQTLEFAYPSVVIQGELANFRVSKNRWVYFDLKDEMASVRFFGTVYQLPGPLEDGMLLEVRGTPRLHPQYGFSITVLSMRPTGEGSIKKAAQLLESKLKAEGLFEEQRKRQLPYPPKKIGLITSAESAAYHDFIKILNERWGGVEVLLIDVQVQGEVAPAQVVDALNYFNQHAEDCEVLVVTRGGGSAEDLAAFSTEQVTRAVAASRIPTLVAIGHEVDISLAELAADKRASTPSNAAQMLVPDKRRELENLRATPKTLRDFMSQEFNGAQQALLNSSEMLSRYIRDALLSLSKEVAEQRRVLGIINPRNILTRGYAIVRGPEGTVLRSVKSVQPGTEVMTEFQDGVMKSRVEGVQ